MQTFCAERLAAGPGGSGDSSHEFQCGEYNRIIKLKSEEETTNEKTSRKVFLCKQAVNIHV